MGNIFIINHKNFYIMTKEQILGIIRHALTFVGGVLITRGIIDEATFTELSGAALTLVGGIWSVVAKNK
jgi:hypothetical protein